MAAEKDESRAKSKCKFQTQRQKEIEAEEDEYDGQWSRYEQRRRDRRNYESSKTKDYDPRMSFTVRSVSDGDSEWRNSFVRNNGLNKSNPIHKLEGVLRICYQETQSQPDMYGVIRHNPRAESNPLLSNLKDKESTQDTTEVVVQILDGILSKIPEHQIECSTI